MDWVTVFDIHRSSTLGDVLQAGVLLGIAGICLAGAADGLRAGHDAGARRFSAMLALAGVFLGFYGVSAFSDRQRVLAGVAALDAGQAAVETGPIAQMVTVRSGRNEYSTSYAFARFKVGQHWFVWPGAAWCRLRDGRQARVAFLPDAGARMTPFIVRIELLGGCAAVGDETQ